MQNVQDNLNAPSPQGDQLESLDLSSIQEALDISLLDGFEGEGKIDSSMIHELELFYFRNEERMDDELKFQLATAYVNLARKLFHYIEITEKGDMSTVAKGFRNNLFLPIEGELDFNQIVRNYTAKQNALDRARAA